MTIKELIVELKKFDTTQDIYISKDGEGNNFMPIDEIATSGRKIIIWPK